MTKNVDTFLDTEGRVVTDPKRAVEMRRVVIDESSGQVVETSVWYVKGAQPVDAPPVKKPTGYERPRGY
jgi:hypothetical protein